MNCPEAVSPKPTETARRMQVCKPERQLQDTRGARDSE